VFSFGVYFEEVQKLNQSIQTHDVGEEKTIGRSEKAFYIIEMFPV